MKRLNHRIDTLTKRNEQLEMKLKTRRAEPDDVMRTETTGKLGEQQDKNAQLALKLSDEQYKNAQLALKLRELQNLVNKYISGNSKDGFVKDLESDRNELIMALKEAKLEIEEKEQKIKDLEKNPDFEVGDIEKIKTVIQEKNDKIEEFENVLSGLETEHEAALDEINKLKNERIEIAKDYESIQTEYQVVKDDIYKKDEIIDSLKNDLENISIHYKNEINSHTQQQSNLESRIELLNQEVANKKLEIINLKTEFAGALKPQDNNKHKELIDEITEKVKILTTGKSKLENENQMMDTKLYEISLQLKQIQHKMSGKDDLIKELQEEITDLQKERSLLNKKLSVKSGKMIDIIDAIEQLQIKNSAISRGVDMIMNTERKLAKESSKVSEKIQDADFTKADIELVKSSYAKKLEASNLEYNKLRNELFVTINDIRNERNKARDAYTVSQSELKTLKLKYSGVQNEVAELKKRLKFEIAEKVKLVAQLKSSQISEWSPPTPISPSIIDNNKIKDIEREVEILEHQKQLLLLKLSSVSERCSDLEYQSKFYELEIDNKNELLEKSANILGLSNGRMLSKEMDPLRKLRVIFLVPLAIARMKRRLKVAKEKERKIGNEKKLIQSFLRG
ncbi:hypothetical protein DAMA08_006820 [Martiniozyma asiatica (nom. inval.)]|nr:hypothetical protein DAMA08_006820 [Martiniozyma asiatica]